MEREIMPDCTGEEFYRYLIPEKVCGAATKSQEETNHCIVFCKKVSPDLFDISKGVAVVQGAKTYFNDGICMIAPSTKVVFVFDNN